MTLWTAASQALLSMRFPRQEYWSGLLIPSPGDLPNLGTEPVSAAWQADSLPLEEGRSLLLVCATGPRAQLELRVQEHAPEAPRTVCPLPHGTWVPLTCLIEVSDAP